MCAEEQLMTRARYLVAYVLYREGDVIRLHCKPGTRYRHSEGLHYFISLTKSVINDNKTGINYYHEDITKRKSRK